MKKCPWTITLQRTNGNMPPASFVISQTKADKIIEWIQPEIKKKTNDGTANSQHRTIYD